MSANTSIKEGGKARSFGPVSALMVQGDDGKYLPWVPESERQLGTKSVNKNGVYQAKKDGVYGWRSFSVNVPTDQGVTGTDPTTGQQVAVGVGPTGELTETVVPVEIRVTTPPFKTSYVSGEIINLAGIVVTAYDINGEALQELSMSDLAVIPIIADYQYSGDWCGGLPVLLGNQATGYYWANSTLLSSGVLYFGDVSINCHDGNRVTVSNSKTGQSNTLNYKYTDFDKPGDYGVKAYVSQGSVGLVWSAPNIMIGGSTGVAATNEVESGQLITLYWPRPGDGAVLETGFYIDVVDVSPNNNDGN